MATLNQVQAINWTNDDVLSNWPPRTNFSENFYSNFIIFHSRKCRLQNLVHFVQSPVCQPGDVATSRWQVSESLMARANGSLSKCTWDIGWRSAWYVAQVPSLNFTNGLVNGRKCDGPQCSTFIHMHASLSLFMCVSLYLCFKFLQSMCLLNIEKQN